MSRSPVRPASVRKTSETCSVTSWDHDCRSSFFHEALKSSTPCDFVKPWEERDFKRFRLEASAKRGVPDSCVSLEIDRLTQSAGWMAPCRTRGMIFEPT